jgi:hypothetical protein
MVASFGTGHRHVPRRWVENTQKIAAPPHAGLAREAVTFLIDGVEQVVEIERQERINGGQQAYWTCPRCGVRRSHLYVLNGSLLCRGADCGRVDHKSRYVPRAVARAAKLRRKLGAAPGLLSPVRKPRHWSPVHYRRLVDELIATERVLAAMLRGTVAALERRNGRVHGPR